MTAEMEESSLKLAVEKKYSSAADFNPAISCCGGGKEYGEGVPLSAKNGSLGCGSPVNYVSLQKGMTIVDLGSGGGVDVFAAANKNRSIRVIGVDSTAKMIARAKRTAKENQYDNVEFRLGEMENLPIDDDFANVVISNCAVNLVPDKTRAFKEMFRILKAGGILTISDIVAKHAIPDRIRNDPARWSECVSGALSVTELQTFLKDAGFSNFRILEESRWEKTEDKDLDLASVTFYAEKPS